MGQTKSLIRVGLAMMILQGSVISISGQCTVSPLPPSFNPNEPIKKIAVRIMTSDSLFSGTSRDVWIDIGSKAWKANTQFDRNSTKTIVLPLTNVEASSGLTPEEVPVFLDDIKFLRLEKKGIGLVDLPPISPEIIAVKESETAKAIGGVTNAPDDLLELTIPGGLTPQNMLDH